ncbi:MAG: hypothetical protein HUJ26_01975 [Planctomycetaceae bacterium]|nr:hypothetical protein [Planctomycetaceae bacterium]
MKLPNVSEISAYHESGHALVALYAGAQVRSITVDPDWDDGPERFADIQIEWPTGQFSETEYHQKNVLIALGGPVAEMIYSGEPYHPATVAEWSNDWEVAWHSAGQFLVGDQKLLTYLEQTSIELYRLLNRDDSWQVIATLADHLLAHETLESDQILEIVEPWL